MALAYCKETDKFTSYAIWKIEETAEELLAQLQLKEHEKSYLETLNKGKRNLHWLSTRVLLRKMMNTGQYIDCRVDEHGKPYLTNFPHHISLSHSHNYAAVMLSENRPVGIDIELINTKIERVAPKFMNTNELAFIDPDHKIEHLYICWCAKEAIYKVHGKKGVSFLDHIKLSPFLYHTEGKFEAVLEIENDLKKYTVNYQKFEEYMVGYVAGEEMSNYETV